MQHLNRVVAVVAAVASLGLAVLPALADFDTSSTAGVIAGIVAVLGITQRWLDGWQKHEERLHGLPAQPVDLTVNTDSETVAAVLPEPEDDDDGPGDVDQLAEVPHRKTKPPKDQGDKGKP